jgi:divalent metal cation (Fe/Co/Zn/Cd) transporter
MACRCAANTRTACDNCGVTSVGEPGRSIALLQRGKRLEWFTLVWNVLGVAVLAVLAVTASSIALAGFGLDSFIEIGASTVVLWELGGTGEVRQRRALKLIGAAFIALAVYLLVQSVVALLSGHRADPSVGGIAWTGVTAVVMFSLAAAKRATGPPSATRSWRPKGG